MAKKSSKKRRRSQAPAQQRAKQAPAATEQRPAARVATEQPVASRATNLADEYHYVTSDLKRIGILAVAMLGLLVILALLAQFVF